MLRDEIAKYTELSGNDGEHTPIGIIGAYLDGYDKGLAIHSIENKGEWIEKDIPDAYRWKCSCCGLTRHCKENFCPNCGADMGSE